MVKLRLGQVDYISYMPVYHPLEEGQLPLDADIIKGSPSKLNKMFLAKELDITPISSIEYARYAQQCYILPNMSIAANGKINSSLLFSKVPVTELEGKRIALTSSSSTSVILLKILLEHYFHVEVEYITMELHLDNMLSKADAALIIGDDAMIVKQQVLTEDLPYLITDLASVWKDFTGERMIFTIWVIQRDYADNNPENVNHIVETLHRSKLLGMKQISTLVEIASRHSGLSLQAVKEYFQLIFYELDDDYQRALITFYDYAYKSGLIEERVKLAIWGENFDHTYNLHGLPRGKK